MKGILQNNEEEVWEDIDNYKGLYKISNYGKVLSFKRNGNSGDKILFPVITKGYYTVKLSKNNISIRVSIHVLVCETFNTKPDFYQCVNHKDSNPLNNFYKNLEFTTFAYNTQHAWLNGRCEKVRANIKKYSIGRTGLLNPVSRPILQIDKDSNIIVNEYDSATFASKETMICRQHISHVCSGSRKSAGGFIWKYKL
jgi:hypothetical protein